MTAENRKMATNQTARRRRQKCDLALRVCIQKYTFIPIYCIQNKSGFHGEITVKNCFNKTCYKILAVNLN